MNEKNLIPLTNMSPRERMERARRGAKKYMELKRKRMEIERKINQINFDIKKELID